MTERARAGRDETDGHVEPGGVRPVAPTRPSDERAVRVRLAAGSASGTDVPMILAPGPADPGVSAQRQWLVDGEPRDVEVVRTGGGRALLRMHDERIPVVVGPARRGPDGAEAREILVDGFRFELEVQDERLAALRERATRSGVAAGRSGPLDVRAAIPGRVISVAVAPGDTVVAGQQLLVVEAMKMQNELRAPRDGTIDRVGIAPGVNIEVGDLLVVISQERTG